MNNRLYAGTFETMNPTVPQLETWRCDHPTTGPIAVYAGTSGQLLTVDPYFPTPKPRPARQQKTKKAFRLPAFRRSPQPQKRVVVTVRGKVVARLKRPSLVKVNIERLAPEVPHGAYGYDVSFVTPLLSVEPDIAGREVFQVSLLLTGKRIKVAPPPGSAAELHEMAMQLSWLRRVTFPVAQRWRKIVSYALRFIGIAS